MMQFVKLMASCQLLYITCLHENVDHELVANKKCRTELCLSERVTEGGKD